MITGFEKETHELTDYELTLVQPMVNGLKTKIGNMNKITNNEMLEAMKSTGAKVTPARIRKLIHFIRVRKLVPNLVSSNKGYWIATTEEELQDYLESLQQRVNSINEIIDSFN